MSNYFLFLYDDPSGWTKLSPEEMQKALEKYIAWGQKATAAGYLRGSHRLAEDLGKVIGVPKSRMALTAKPRKS